MNLEQMKNIVDGAPEWADNFNVYIAAYGSGRVLCKGDVLLDDLRAELAKREPMDLRAVDIPHGAIVLEK
ncbi:MAG: hypothetical protein J6S68_14395 [Acinetobacter sp.]|nr:hypothetical protein [Acinetobacter sp.]